MPANRMCSSLHEDLAIASKVVEQSLPMISVYLLGYSIMDTILFYFVAQLRTETQHESDVIFAGVSLASMFGNISCLSILWGLASAVETMASQLHGAQMYREVGLVLVRSIGILACVCLPLGMLWIFAYSIFRAVGIEADVCLIIYDSLCIRVWELPAMVVICSFESFLVAIDVTTPLVKSNVALDASFVCLCVLSLLLLNDCSFRALMWARVLATYISGAVAIILGLRYEEVNRILFPPAVAPGTTEAAAERQRLVGAGGDEEHAANGADSPLGGATGPLSFTEAMSDRKAIWEFFSLGGSGVVMICAEWWAYEVLTLFAGMLGTEQVDAQSIIFAVVQLTYCIPGGMATMVTSIVGNYVGANEASIAKRTSVVSMVLMGVAGASVGVLVYTVGAWYIRLFTSDPAVLSITNEAMPMLALLVCGDGVQTVGSGILKGAGRQNEGAIINFSAYYIVGLPVSWLLCFTWHMGVPGLILGMVLANWLQVLLHTVLLSCYSDYVFSSEGSGWLNNTVDDSSFAADVAKGNSGDWDWGYQLSGRVGSDRTDTSVRPKNTVTAAAVPRSICPGRRRSGNIRRGSGHDLAAFNVARSNGSTGGYAEVPGESSTNRNRTRCSSDLGASTGGIDVDFGISFATSQSLDERSNGTSQSRSGPHDCRSPPYNSYQKGESAHDATSLLELSPDGCESGEIDGVERSFSV